MFWVIQSNLFSEYNYERLLSTLERLGLPHSLHRVVPSEAVIDPEPTPPDDRVIVMGSYTLSRLAARRGWRPGSFVANLDFEVQRSHWGELMLNHDARVFRFAEVPEQTYPSGPRYKVIHRRSDGVAEVRGVAKQGPVPRVRSTGHHRGDQGDDLP